MHFESPSKLVRCTQIAQRGKKDPWRRIIVQVLQKLPHYCLMVLWKEDEGKGTKRTFCNFRLLQGTGGWNKLMALQALQTMRQKPSETPCWEIPGKTSGSCTPQPEKTRQREIWKATGEGNNARAAPESQETAGSSEVTQDWQHQQQNEQSAQ